MILIGQMLQRAGVPFMSASGRHTAKGLADVQVTVASEDDAEAVRRWSDQEGIDVVIRRATPEEVREHEEIPW